MDNTENMSNEISLAVLLPLIEEKLAAGGEVVFKPRGMSMLPLIRQGVDSVVLESAEKPQKGDVILYRRQNGQFVLHRIVGRNDDGYVLCGDNQFVFEYGVTEDLVIGVMKGIWRGKKYVPCTRVSYRIYKRPMPLIRFWKRAENCGRRIVGKMRNDKGAV